MEKNKELDLIEKKVLDSIKSGKVHMKPRWYFVLRISLIVTILFSAFFALIYLLSFIGLVFYEKKIFDLLNLGPRGLRAFMSAIPWVVIFVSMLSFSLLYVLIKRYSFVYKKPLAYSFFGLVFIVVLLGFVINVIDSNFRFARIGEKPKDIILGPMHKYYRGDIKNRPSEYRPRYQYNHENRVNKIKKERPF
jgi:glucan phosphoethanolaminetransferase (alkaline phosphatase superfamily)